MNGEIAIYLQLLEKQLQEFVYWYESHLWNHHTSLLLCFTCFGSWSALACQALSHREVQSQMIPDFSQSKLMWFKKAILPCFVTEVQKDFFHLCKLLRCFHSLELAAVCIQLGAGSGYANDEEGKPCKKDSNVRPSSNENKAIFCVVQQQRFMTTTFKKKKLDFISKNKHLVTLVFILERENTGTRTVLKTRAEQSLLEHCKGRKIINVSSSLKR